jgi:hypothetical protein
VGEKLGKVGRVENNRIKKRIGFTREAERFSLSPEAGGRETGIYICCLKLTHTAI